MPHYSRTERVQAPPAAVFAILDDVSRAPEWLKRCTQLDNLSGGPTAVGTKLRYHYRNGWQRGVMDGSVVARELDRKLTNTFTDKAMTVTVDFDVQPTSDGGTTLTHTIQIDPKGLFKVLTPMINRQLPTQTASAMTELKQLAESGR